MRLLTPTEFLDEIRSRGALRIRRVSFRKNRSTIWSLTQRATVLNVHAAYRAAPVDLLDAFAVIATEGGLTSGAAREAGRRVHEWPLLNAAIEDARQVHEVRRTAGAAEGRHVAYCCGTTAQRTYLRALYDYFNLTRFGDRLPTDLPLRFSNRMRSRLGHMVAGGTEDQRVVVEIALNIDLLLKSNGAERVDTLLHEMAHAADYLATGHHGHGRSWRELAQNVGCTPQLLYGRPVLRRRRRSDAVVRVPPIPSALLRAGRSSVRVDGP